MTEEQKIRRRAWQQAYRKNNPEKTKRQQTTWRQKNYATIQAKQQAYDRTHREAKNAGKRRRYKLNPYSELQKEEKKKYLKAWALLNSEKKKQSDARWYQRNKKERTEKGKIYSRQRYQNNLVYNLTMKVRHRIREAIKNADRGVRKSNSTIELLGCSFTELRLYIENQFTSGMSWEAVRAGAIHLDHKRPCASFDLADLEQQKICFHYTNLQPLWAKDNLSKGAKWQAGS